MCNCGVRWYGCPTHARWHEHAYAYNLFVQAQDARIFQRRERKQVDTTNTIPTLDGMRRKRVRRSNPPFQRSRPTTLGCKRARSGITRAKGQALSTSSCDYHPIFRDTGETSTLRAVPYPLACGQEAASSTCLRGQHHNASNSTASSCKAQPQMSPCPQRCTEHLSERRPSHMHYPVLSSWRSSPTSSPDCDRRHRQ